MRLAILIILLTALSSLQGRFQESSPDVMADMYFNQMKYEDALRYYDMVIKLDSTDFNAVFRRGLSKSYLRNETAAIADFTRALGLTEDEKHVVYFNRAYSYSNIGKPARAIIDYSSAIALKSDYAEAYNNRGLLKEQMGATDAALEDFQHAVRLDSNNLSYNYNTGRLLYKSHKPFEAIAYLKKTIAIKPAFTASYIYLGDCHTKLHDYSNAMVYYSKAIESDTINGEAYLKRGFAEVALQIFDAGCDDFTKAVELGNTKASKLKAQFCE